VRGSPSRKHPTVFATIVDWNTPQHVVAHKVRSYSGCDFLSRHHSAPAMHATSHTDPLT